jgi:hypothetical protein
MQVTADGRAKSRGSRLRIGKPGNRGSK